MQDQFISLGKSIRFSCNATGLPIPSITWLKDGTPISNGHRIVLNRSLLPKNILSSDLQLSLASSRDEGVYQCVAKNSIEEKVAGARLIVGGENHVCLSLVFIYCNLSAIKDDAVSRPSGIVPDCL